MGKEIKLGDRKAGREVTWEIFHDWQIRRTVTETGNDNGNGNGIGFVKVIARLG